MTEPVFAKHQYEKSRALHLNQLRIYCHTLPEKLIALEKDELDKADKKWILINLAEVQKEIDWILDLTKKLEESK